MFTGKSQEKRQIKKVILKKSSETTLIQKVKLLFYKAHKFIQDARLAKK